MRIVPHLLAGLLVLAACLVQPFAVSAGPQYSCPNIETHCDVR